MKNKIKAFTILEMLVNLTIMSIIMGLVYFAYTSFVQQIMGYRESIERQNELSRIYVQMKKDFYVADKVVRESKGFRTMPYDENEITYKVTDKYLIRKQSEVSDTLKISGIDIISVLNMNTNEDLVTKLVVFTTLFEEPLQYTLVKNYAPNLKLNM